MGQNDDDFDESVVTQTEEGEDDREKRSGSG
jgi:hypothetical protein